MSTVLLQMKNIWKKFGANQVLKNAQLELHEGEVHALLGENGAGKSTLMKILMGIYSKDEGEIYVDGKLAQITNADEGKAYGVSIIHQELMLSQNMSVAENFFMGREIVTKHGFIDLKKQNQFAKQVFDQFQLDLNPLATLKNLTIAQQQMVEIVRAISFGARIVVMDEPTSSLSSQEIQKLYEMIRMLKRNGVGIIYISHKLNELYDIADNVTVLRDGEYVATVKLSETSKEELVRMMVGREISKYYYKSNTPTEDVVLCVKNIGDDDKMKDVSFDLYKGEILGISGLVGAGRSEALQSLVGLKKRTHGTVLFEGKEVNFKTLSDAIECGIGYVPEDRKLEGLFQKQSVQYNITINILSKIIRRLRVNKGLEKKIVNEKLNQFAIKSTSIAQIVSELSGGNQQKVLIARWLLATSKVLVLDEPARGVDVKSKAEIYQLIDWMVNHGMSVIMISSELPELINMSDRICVFSNGRTTGILTKDEFDQERIMTLATM